MTPEVRPGGNNQSNSMTMKMQMYQIDMHGSLSVISEEKSMQLQESISAASSHMRQNLLYSATMSSAFNSAHKQSLGPVPNLNRNRSKISDKKNISLPLSEGKDRQDSSFMLEEEMLRQQSVETELRINRHQKSDECNPFPGNIMNESDDAIVHQRESGDQLLS